jgi:hypothetical protein
LGPLVFTVSPRLRRQRSAGPTDPGANGQLTLNASNAGASGSILRFTTSHGDARARSWAIFTNNAAWGDFSIAQSSAAGGDPLANVRLYISASGSVLVGAGYNTNTYGDLGVARSGGLSGAIFLQGFGSRYLYYDGTNYIMPGANLVLNGVTVSSSRHLKKNVRDFPQATRRLRVRLFERIAGGGTSLGFVAEEVEPIFPEGIAPIGAGANGEDIGKLGIDLMAVVAKHEQDIQALQDNIAAPKH